MISKPCVINGVTVRVWDVLCDPWVTLTDLAEGLAVPTDALDAWVAENADSYCYEFRCGKVFFIGDVKEFLTPYGLTETHIQAIYDAIGRGVMKP